MKPVLDDYSNDDMLRFCSVTFKREGQEYTYFCPDEDINEGDTVSAPVGGDFFVKAVVTKIFFCRKNETTIPWQKIKQISGKTIGSEKAKSEESITKTVPKDEYSAFEQELIDAAKLAPEKARRLALSLLLMYENCDDSEVYDAKFAPDHNDEDEEDSEDDDFEDDELSDEEDDEDEDSEDDELSDEEDDEDEDSDDTDEESDGSEGSSGWYPGNPESSLTSVLDDLFDIDGDGVLDDIEDMLKYDAFFGDDDE